MKTIAIDFKNCCICLMLDGQQGTEIHLEINNKQKFISMFPSEELMNSSSSFTWNFEDEIFAVNKEYIKSGNPNEIMTKDCFIPIKIITYPGLSDKYNEMLSLIGYEETRWTEDDFRDFPDEFKALFRHLF